MSLLGLRDAEHPSPHGQGRAPAPGWECCPGPAPSQLVAISSCPLLPDATVPSPVPAEPLHSTATNWHIFHLIKKKMHFYSVCHSKYFLLVLGVTASHLHYSNSSNFPSPTIAIPAWGILAFSALPTTELPCTPDWVFFPWVFFFSLGFFSPSVYHFQSICVLRGGTGVTVPPGIHYKSVINLRIFQFLLNPFLLFLHFQCLFWLILCS